MKARGLGVVTGLVVVQLIAGCGGSETETVVERQTVIEKAPPEAKPEAEAEPAPEATPEDAGGKITVPDVTGKDHQLAQDTMQAAGLYTLVEKDATGQGRLLVLDRNWTTVKQTPAAGTQVSEDATITLSAKKDGE